MNRAGTAILMRSPAKSRLILIGTAVAQSPCRLPFHETRSMTRQPDEDYVVIVHYFGQRGRSGTGRDTWTIWLGGEKQGERVTVASAVELASDAALTHSGAPWLLDETGYPLMPLESPAKSAH